MPTYEYECPRCPRVFELRQPITEPSLTTCDRCGGPVHRLLSATPFILKGGGWYVTDYPSEARKKASSSEAADKAPAGSEAKPSTGSGAPSSPPTGGSPEASGPPKDSGKPKDSAKSKGSPKSSSAS